MDILFKKRITLGITILLIFLVFSSCVYISIAQSITKNNSNIADKLEFNEIYEGKKKEYEETKRQNSRG